MNGERKSSGRDYWDVVLERLARRRPFRLALAVLALLYASAIYAPLLANDRPFWLEAIDYRAFEQARRILVPATSELVVLLAEGETSARPRAGALDDQGHAVTSRTETLERYLPADERAGPRALRTEVERALELARADRWREAQEAAAGLWARAQDLSARLVPIQPGKEGGTVELRPALSFPLFEATSGLEAFFMVAWAFVLSFPAWNRLVNRVWLGGDRERIRRARKRKLACVLGVAFGSGFLWQVVVGGEMAFHTAPYKEALTRGDILATRVLFPPIAFGFAETHLEEALRPPTWTSASETLAERVPVEVRFGEPAEDAAWRHPLGADGLGRDGLGRILWGGRVSLSVGLVSTAVLMTIGILVGALAGYFGGWLDFLLSRAIEIVMCFPVFFLILVVVAFLGPSILTIMVVLGALRWTGVARLARGEFLRLKALDFVVAARATGLSSARILFRHVLPNAMGPLLVAASFSLASGVLIESGLSFLHFGIQDPIPSWGALLNESQQAAHWWIHVFPGCFIFLTVLCTNLVGDAVRDAMDPKLEVGP